MLSELVDWTESHDRRHTNADRVLAEALRFQHRRTKALVVVVRELAWLTAVAWTAVVVLAIGMALR